MSAASVMADLKRESVLSPVMVDLAKRCAENIEYDRLRNGIMLLAEAWSDARIKYSRESFQCREAEYLLEDAVRALQEWKSRQ